jgi:predicted component of type VI protein secretion system
VDANETRSPIGGSAGLSLTSNLAIQIHLCALLDTKPMKTRVQFSEMRL